MNFTDSDVLKYAIEHSTPISKESEKLASYTRKHAEMSQMLIGELEGSFLGFLVRSIGAKRVLEFGTFTGFSALIFAENLPDDGEVVTLDINEETARVAKKFWKKSGQERKIKQLLGPASETLQSLEGPFDFIFIDADKENYSNYFEASLKLISDRGVIAVDNVLWSGRVLDPNVDDNQTRAIQQLNSLIRDREDVYKTLLPIRDGIFLVQRFTRP